MKYLKTEKKCGRINVWGKWDDRIPYDILITIPYNRLRKYDVRRAEFLANKIKEVIEVPEIDEEFWKTQERYVLEQDDELMPYKIMDKRSSSRQPIARFYSKNSAKDCLGGLNWLENKKIG